MLKITKHKTFNLKARLNEERGIKEKRIEFDRLPRKKVKPIWWSIFILAMVVTAIFYLQKF